MQSTFSKNFGIKNWWLHLISGILMIIAAFIILANPLAGYAFISAFFRISLFVSGMIETIFAVVNRKELQGWGWNLAIGITDGLVGLILIIHPALSLAIVPFILGFWLMFRGSTLMAFSLLLKNLRDPHWGWLFAGSIFLTIFAVYIIINPALGVATAIAFVCGGFLATGITNIAFSLRLKKLKT